MEDWLSESLVEKEYLVKPEIIIIEENKEYYFMLVKSSYMNIIF
jgi:hypothetical protein